MSTLSRNEAGLLNRATLTANEQRDAPGPRSFMPIGINMNQQLPDLTAGIGGSHLRRSEGHPRQALACIGRQGRPTGALDLILDAGCGLGQGCCGPCWCWDGGLLRGGNGLGKGRDVAMAWKRCPVLRWFMTNMLTEGDPKEPGEWRHWVRMSAGRPRRRRARSRA